ncbi:MAG: ATP-binding protein [Candidatus Cloacimonetes bacterium]|jgi:anti-sigma regulatory factor (Ser/Thr protein kinase)|nr:ATP-binding protein [Candidatus Cloacimonadota bacterium]
MMEASLTLEARLQELDRLLAFVDQIAQSIISSFVLQLVCEEVFTNIIRHAGLSPEQQIIFSYRSSPESLFLSFQDWGRPYDPEAISPSEAQQELEQIGIGGQGWRLIRHYVDQLDYNRKDESNILSLTIHLPRS